MPNLDENSPASRWAEGDRANPRHLALVGMEALANYKRAGLVLPQEKMHEQLAVRLARIATTNNWEG